MDLKNKVASSTAAEGHRAARRDALAETGAPWVLHRRHARSDEAKRKPERASESWVGNAYDPGRAPARGHQSDALDDDREGHGPVDVLLHAAGGR